MKNKGITLISLVITIIILIILSSVGIYLSLGNNGIFTRAKQAKETTNKQTATLKELSVVLGTDNEIQYVTEKSQIASTKYEVGENPSSIYTKLNDYPYEFEINGQLQLASINGIKIATNEQKGDTILLETTDINEEEEIQLQGNIYDYKKIEIFLAVCLESGEKLWNSVSIYTSDIELSSIEQWKTTIPMYIASNTNYYSYTHFIFTANNKINFLTETYNNWSILKYKIKVIGYEN